MKVETVAHSEAYEMLLVTEDFDDGAEEFDHITLYSGTDGCLVLYSLGEVFNLARDLSAIVENHPEWHNA